MEKIWRAIDLFAGCGGLSWGLSRSGFRVVSAVEIDELAASTYKMNLPGVRVIQDDIRNIRDIKHLSVGKAQIDLIAGCPPCQGFSRVRRRNRRDAAIDPRNDLVGEFARIVEKVQPRAVFMENVPGIESDGRFTALVSRLKEIGYNVNWETLELSEFGVPQRRRRVVVLAGKGFTIPIPRPRRTERNVRWAIGDLPDPSKSKNPLHNQITSHLELTLKRIRAVPKNGGSRQDWPTDLQLGCHTECNGFRDVYGRMAWDEPAPTITGGCINASKGRFLHPKQNRAITLLEAALLQTFNRRYRLSLERGRYAAAEMIGNALPPHFAYRVGLCVRRALEKHVYG